MPRRKYELSVLTNKDRPESPGSVKRMAYLVVTRDGIIKEEPPSPDLPVFCYEDPFSNNEIGQPYSSDEEPVDPTKITRRLDHDCFRALHARRRAGLLDLSKHRAMGVFSDLLNPLLYLDGKTVMDESLFELEAEYLCEQLKTRGHNVLAAYEAVQAKIAENFRVIYGLTKKEDLYLENGELCVPLSEYDELKSNGEEVVRRLEESKRLEQQYQLQVSLMDYTLAQYSVLFNHASVVDGKGLLKTCVHKAVEDADDMLQQIRRRMKRGSPPSARGGSEENEDAAGPANPTRARSVGQEAEEKGTENDFRMPKRRRPEEKE